MLTNTQIDNALSGPIYIADYVHPNGNFELIMRFIALTGTFLIEYFENGKCVEATNSKDREIALTIYNGLLETKGFNEAK
jgi:hypothetical protein